MRGKPGAHALLDVFDECVGADVARREHHERLDALPAQRVGRPDHRRLTHRGVLEQAVLDLAGAMRCPALEITSSLRPVYQK